MDQSAVRELAHQIANEQISATWPFWLILLGLVAALSALASFGGAYLARRGQVRAEASELDALVLQLRATTEAAERVRVEIQHADWTAREWKTIRRVKLEDYYVALHSVLPWAERIKDRVVFNGSEPDLPDPTLRVETLARIYFPELVAPTLAFTLSARYLNVLSFKAGGGLLKTSAPEERSRMLDDYSKEFRRLYEKCAEQQLELGEKAPALIDQILRN